MVGSASLHWRLPLALTQAAPRAAAVLVDEFDVCILEDGPYFLR
jgi:hypothetical protein